MEEGRIQRLKVWCDKVQKDNPFSMNDKRREYLLAQAQRCIDLQPLAQQAWDTYPHIGGKAEILYREDVNENDKEAWLRVRSSTAELNYLQVNHPRALDIIEAALRVMVEKA